MGKKDIIGVWYGGLVGLGIEIFDINSDYVIYRWVTGEKVGKITKARIRTNYDNDEFYFISKGYEIKLSECMRV